MRRQYWVWSMGVLGIFGTVYGAYLLAYHQTHNNKLSVPALILLILGIMSLSAFMVVAISRYFFNKKKKNEVPPKPIETPKEEKPEPTTTQELKEVASLEPQEKPIAESKVERSSPKREPQRSYASSSSYSYSIVYVKLVGYGPVLRVEGNRIIDMRTNTYYRIEGNNVMQEGYGIRYEIRGNQIRNAFGGYLYELSGNNINKVFGGFYASISGNYITLFDQSKKFETTDSLSKKQILPVTALLFGSY